MAIHLAVVVPAFADLRELEVCWMGLPWIRFDTSLFDHPKILELKEANQYKAIVVHLEAMTYSGKHQLGGFVPRSALRVIGGTQREVTKLRGVGLWDHTDDDSGWRLHDWGDYQRLYQDLAAEDIARRQQISQTRRNAARKRWDKHRGPGADESAAAGA
ncbi:hypothetical protein [Nocardia wallacei]|uniref:hypothetical protein n=1 Tax=Nocardia wallacei TaxID=480035 RepID=UPI0024540B2A|nr:hypothetical protein [Nocardia wallacei]